MPIRRPLAVPSSVMAMVEWPVRAFSSSTSVEGELLRGERLESETTLAGLVGLDTADHGGLILDALGAVDEGDAPLAGQGNGQLLTRD